MRRRSSAYLLIVGLILPTASRPPSRWYGSIFLQALHNNHADEISERRRVKKVTSVLGRNYGYYMISICFITNNRSYADSAQLNAGFSNAT
ncbi:hypothetical protein F5Y04DRAFT_211061 [Hypomontagnella monticulosa]|nr:hypothetical protein F5Y04DRAFT_211061 [Hypomontagnella monticulosa]